MGKTPNGNETQAIALRDIVRVVYSAGKVFDGLATGRLATEAFILTGDTSGIASRRDVELLRDLKDIAQLVIDRAGSVVDSEYVRSLNAAMTRSGALRPGELRRDDQRIGVRTPFGRHEPPALTEAGLQRVVADAMVNSDLVETALNLFVDLAKAQPFEDGNKRTAIFAANGHLLAARTGLILTAPVDDGDPTVAAEFVEGLASAYIHSERDRVKTFMRAHGVVAFET